MSSVRCPHCSLVVGEELLIRLPTATVCPNCLDRYKWAFVEGPPEVRQRHSGLGIASFVLSAVMLVVLLGLFAFAGYLEVSTPGGVDEESPTAIFVGLAILGALLLEAVAFAMGLATLFQRDRIRLFGILGMSLSALFALGTIGLILFGLAMGG